MSIKTTTVRTCDLCGVEMDGVLDARIKICGLDKYIYFSPKLFINYGMHEGDVCLACLRQMADAYGIEKK